MFSDFRFALRNLLRNRAFSLAAVLTLAVGLGANTAMFSVVYGVLLRPLPYPEADRIVRLQTTWKGQPAGRGDVSGPDFRDWQQQSASFESMAYSFGGEMGVKAGEFGEFAGMFVVSPQFFAVLGAAPVAGRLFSPDEQKPKGPNAALVSEEFARSHYGEPALALRRVLRIADESFPIVGVLPGGFHYPIRGTTKADIWMPSAWVGENSSRTAQNYSAVARLRRGSDVRLAQAELDTISARLEAAWPKENHDKRVAVVPLAKSVTGASEATLQLLMGAVGLLLLLSCANVANMLLARATSRSREFALRAAIGASRWQIVRQLLTESALLAGAAAITGLAIAFGVREALLALAPASLPRVEETGISVPAVLFLTAISAAVTFLFGLGPALTASRIDLNVALRQGGQKGVLGSGPQRMRQALVVGQIALSLVLTTGAGLLFRSFVALTDTDMGFRPGQLVVMSASVAARSDEGVKKATRYFGDLVRELQSVPGVQSAAAVMGLPTGKRSSEGTYEIQGRTESTSLSSMPRAGLRIATPAWFATMGTPLLAGRDFSEHDSYDAPLVAVVNETLVRRQFPDGQAIGKQIRCGLDRKGWMTIVGVAGDVRHDSPSRAPNAEIYMPYGQHPWMSDEMHVVIRSSLPASAVASEGRRIAASLNPEVSLSFSTMTALLSDAVSTPRFRSVLMGAFAALAGILAMAGVYGVLAYLVSRRVPEMGLRLALGAGTADIVGLVLREALWMTGGGIALGLAAALVLQRLLAGMLFEVKPLDPLTYGIAAGAIASMAILTAAVPSWRAARVTATEALRAD